MPYPKHLSDLIKNDPEIIRLNQIIWGLTIKIENPRQYKISFHQLKGLRKARAINRNKRTKRKNELLRSNQLSIFGQ